MFWKKSSLILAVAAAGVLTACGQEADMERNEPESVERSFEEDEEAINEAEDTGESQVLEEDTEKAENADRWKEKFGENCIAEQTFEVELSEYDSSVFFVPFAPSADAQEFHIQIIRDGEVLTELSSYVPEELAGEAFSSLDAVSFFDVNYDDNTDIVLIETCGDTSFAAVYYGFTENSEELESCFVPQEQLSEQISEQAETLSIPGIRDLLSNGKKNGEFSDYQEAYRAVSSLCGLESAGEAEYALIYVDEDEMPELAAGVSGYYVSLYTYEDGKVYGLMDHWAYGAMGNSGYEYAPGKNNIRNYNTDYAGAVLYTTYMEVGSRHTLDVTAEIKTVNFDDANENGVPDEDEMGSLGMYGVNYMYGKEVSEEECEVYDAGDYKQIYGTMDLETLRAEL